MPYPVLPEDFGGRAKLLKLIGDVIQGPWGRQSIESGVPIVPGTGQPGGMSPPAPGGVPRGTELSRSMAAEPMWTKWGQGMNIPVDRLLKAVPALRENWNLSDNEIKYYFTLMKQRGEL